MYAISWLKAPDRWCVERCTVREHHRAAFVGILCFPESTAPDIGFSRSARCFKLTDDRVLSIDYSLPGHDVVAYTQ